MRWSRFARMGLYFAAACPSAGLAQNSQCQPFTGTEGNLCNAAIDGLRIYQPVVGQLMSGGNPELGRVGMVGGLGHFAVTFRANVAQVNLPSDGYDGSNNIVPVGDDVTAPAPTVDLAVGLYGGLESGLLAVDFLGALQLLPGNSADITIDPGAASIGGVTLGFGAGLRVGLVGNDTSPLAATASLMWRKLPTYTYTSGAYAFGTDLAATNLRAVLGWHASVFSVGFGGGVDWYSGDGRAAFADPSLPFLPQSVAVDVATRRFLAFADLALVFPVVSLAFEVGYQFGEDEQLATTFEGFPPGDGLLFLSAGVKLGM